MPYSQPSGTFNDSATGVMPFGSQVVTIGGVSYIANSINIKKPTNVLTGKNEAGVPFRETLVNQVFTGDMELQLADVTTVAPAINAPFTVKEAGGGTLNCKVSDVSDMFKAEGETVISVSFRQRFAA